MSDFRPLALPVGHNWHLMYSVKFEKNADTADMAVLQADVLLSLTNAKFLPIMAFLSIVRWCTKIEKYQVSFLLEGISRAVWVQITKYGKICAIALLCMFNFLCRLAHCKGNHQFERIYFMKMFYKLVTPPLFTKDYLFFSLLFLLLFTAFCKRSRGQVFFLVMPPENKVVRLQHC